MSTTLAAPREAIGIGFAFSDWSRRLRVPLDAWSARRRWVVAALIAVTVFASGAHGWVVADLSGVEASRLALNTVAAHLADGRRALAQLPVLRAQAGVPSSPGSAPWTSADDVRVVSQLAAENSVTLLAVEPGTASSAGMEMMRPLQITARTDFVHLMAFLRGLSDLPVLVVPVDVTVRQDGALLSMNASLRVFNALRPVPDAAAAGTQLPSANPDSDDEENEVFFDPFAVPQIMTSGAVSDAMQLRLTGLLRDSTRALALLDTADGATTVASGQRIGTERVTRLDALGITLASGGGATRTLAFEEAL